jgi:hypothetical protein
LILLIFSACTPEERPSGNTIVRDSLGIEVVENPKSSGAPLEDWVVRPEPTASIGVASGEPKYELSGVAGAVRLSNGRIALVDRGSAEIRIYDENGVFRQSHGGAGEGPGEFLSPVLAGRLGGDTLVVVDLNLRRISLFHAGSGFLSSAQVTEEIGLSVYPRGMFADGTIVVGGGYFWSPGQEERVSSGYARPQATYQSVGLDGDLDTDFGGFPGAELQVSVTDSSISVEIVPFSRHTVVAVGEARFYVGLRDQWEVKAFDQQGRLMRIIRVSRDPDAVEETDIEALIQEKAGSDAEVERELRRDFATMEIPKMKPAFASLNVDVLGFLWVRRQPVPGDKLDVYDLVDPEGTLVGQVRMPSSVRILEIGEDYLLALYQDELEVESVRLYQLSRPSLLESPW